MDINRGRHTNRLRLHASVLVIQRFFSCKYAPFDLDGLFQSITSRFPFDLKRQTRIIEFINKRPFFLSLFAPNRAAKKILPSHAIMILIQTFNDIPFCG